MLKRRCSYVANSFADVMQIGSHKGPKSLTFDRVIDHILVPWSLRRHVVNCGVAEEDRADMRSDHLMVAVTLDFGSIVDRDAAKQQERCGGPEI